MLLALYLHNHILPHYFLHATEPHYVFIYFGILIWRSNHKYVDQPYPGTPLELPRDKLYVHFSIMALLDLTLHQSTTTLFDSTWIYITLLWLYLILLASTLLYQGSTLLYFTLQDSIMNLLDSTSLQMTLTCLNSTLHSFTMALLDSTWLYINLP